MSENLKRHRPDIKVLGEGRAIAFMPEDPMGVWVHIQEVRDMIGVKDKVIAELKAENLNLKAKNIELQSFYNLHGNVDNYIDKLKAENEQLKAKLEDVQATAYAESVDAGMRERRLRRALWISRANRALEKIAWFKLWNASISTMNPEDGARQEFDKWKKALGKFLSKAKEYK